MKKKGLRTPVEIASLSVARDFISLFIFNPFAAAIYGYQLLLIVRLITAARSSLPHYTYIQL